MKNSLWLVLATFLSLSVISCNRDCDDCGVVSQRYVHKYGFDVSPDEWNKREQNGKVITELESGVIQTQTFKAGKLHGPTTVTFPESSIIEKELLFDNGILVKEVVNDSSGIPIRAERHEFDNRNVITNWDQRGVPLSVEEYENGQLLKGQYFNQSHEEESSIESGYGVRTKRDREGSLLAKEQFEEGMMTLRTTYHSNGEAASVSPFVNSVLHGAQKAFSPTGAQTLEANWDNGVVHGMKVLYKNSKTINEIPYIYGEKHGLEKKYDASGDLAAEINWIHDEKHGSDRTYDHEDTKIGWFFHGTSVTLRKFQMLEFREQMLAELNGDELEEKQDVVLETPDE